MARLRETAEESCRALIYLASKKDRPLKQRRLLLRDLAWKLSKVYKERRLALGLDLASRFVPKYVKSEVMDKLQMHSVPKPQGNVAFIVIKPIELNAAKVVLGVNSDEDPEEIIHGFRFWRREISRTTPGQPLSVFLTMVGTDGPVPCANACRTIADNFNIDLFVLCGMAAGVRGKTTLGHVIAIEKIIDYEGARKEVRRTLDRPEQSSVEPSIHRDLMYYLANSAGTWAGFKDALSSLAKLAPIPKLAEDWEPKIEQGVMLSGAKLVADGSIPRMREKYHERSRCLDMEGAGFSRTCDELMVPWVAFKGISDFGDPKSKDISETGDPDRKAWQAPASLAAATAALNFLRREYQGIT